MSFQDKLEKVVLKNNSLVCIGLDPDYTKLLPKTSLYDFNKSIIDKTYDLVCAYKPQVAFYSAQGLEGLKDLQKTVRYIRQKNPQIPIILDAKRADVPTTAEMYAKEAFDFFEADAVTVNPYLGFDSIEPFLKRKDKGIIVLCKTSNQSASEFQNLKVDGEPLYIKVAQKVIDWDKKYKNLLMVVGATYPTELKKIRCLTSSMTFLIPGIGSQSGDLKATLENGLRQDKKGLIISASRSIIYAPDPRQASQKLKDEINQFR